jgi:hypothetical protein
MRTLVLRWKQFAWLAAIWLATVLAVALLAEVIRFCASRALGAIH